MINQSTQRVVLVVAGQSGPYPTRENGLEVFESLWGAVYTFAVATHGARRHHQAAYVVEVGMCEQEASLGISVSTYWLCEGLQGAHLTVEYTVKGVIFFGDSSSVAGSLNTVGFRFKIWPSAPCPEPRKR